MTVRPGDLLSAPWFVPVLAAHIRPAVAAFKARRASLGDDVVVVFVEGEGLDVFSRPILHSLADSCANPRVRVFGELDRPASEMIGTGQAFWFVYLSEERSAGAVVGVTDEPPEWLRPEAKA